MSLSFNEYQKRTAETAIYQEQVVKILNGLKTDDPHILRRVGNILNIAYISNGLGEVGEVQGKIKKIIRDSLGVITEEHRQQLAGELGDVLWYLSQMASELGLPLEKIAASNLDKLASRKERGMLQGSGDER